MKKNVFALIVMSLLIIGCGGKKVDPSASNPVVDDLTGKTVSMKSKVPYKEGSFIKAAIKNECTLPQQLADFTKTYSAEHQVTINNSDSATIQNSPYYLDVEIVDAISKGNAFFGHFKQSKVHGVLYKNGTQIADFMGLRSTRGGFGAGFKGSCAVLSRTVDTLGRDISIWLQHPRAGAILGE
jgi:hypothetical protein